MIPNARDAPQKCAGSAAGYIGKSQTVGKFMQEHGRQVDIVAVIVVQPVVKEGAGKATGLPQVGIESGSNLRSGGIEI